jgi:hypothetical protein
MAGISPSSRIGPRPKLSSDKEPLEDELDFSKSRANKRKTSIRARRTLACIVALSGLNIIKTFKAEWDFLEGYIDLN